MRAERGEEAAMLLSAYQQAAQRDAGRLMQRRRAIRTLFGVVGAVALLVGCIAAVDVFALNGGNGESTVTLEVTTGYGDADVDDEAIAMESQFGWNSIGYGWCSLKSSTWCMFSKDKEQCKQGINCYKNREQAANDEPSEGSGSGDFNATVGDADVGDDEDETPSAAAPATPADNPTEPLDLGGDDGSDEGDDEAPADDDEEAPADNEDDETPTDDEIPEDEESSAGDDETSADEEAPADDEVADDEEAPADDEETSGEESVTEDKDGDEDMGGEA